MIQPFPWRRRPRVPAGERIYAIGDVHGRYDLLDDLIRAIADEQRALEPRVTHLVLLGDLIDRGPHSARVIAFALKARRDKMRVVVLKGNHEESLVEAWRGDRDALAGWLQFGGVETLLSFGADGAAIDPRRLDDMLALLRATVPVEVVDWLDALPLIWRRGDYAFVHAGVRPGIPLGRQEAPDLLWIRDEFLGYDGGHGPVIVHGHSISDGVDVRPNRIGVDTGAYATGRLSAICLCDSEQRAISVARAARTSAAVA